SSSGNAVAIASGMADVAFGTDTAGSIGVPAACCGIVGVKTTYGLISIERVYPIETEQLDTIGPMAKDIASTVKAMVLCQGGQVTYTTTYRAAVARQKAWQQTLSNVFENVDVIAVPTLQKMPPGLPLLNLRIGILEALVLEMQNTVAVSFAGNPALAMPIPVRNKRVPATSLQLVGPRLREAELLNVGRQVEEAVKDREERE